MSYENFSNLGAGCGFPDHPEYLRVFDSAKAADDNPDMWTTFSGINKDNVANYLPGGSNHHQLDAKINESLTHAWKLYWLSKRIKGKSYERDLYSDGETMIWSVTDSAAVPMPPIDRVVPVRPGRDWELVNPAGSAGDPYTYEFVDGFFQPKNGSYYDFWRFSRPTVVDTPDREPIIARFYYNDTFLGFACPIPVDPPASRVEHPFIIAYSGVGRNYNLFAASGLFEVNPFGDYGDTVTQYSYPAYTTLAGISVVGAAEFMHGGSD